ncbi:hydroxyproline-rich glycoprotein family protein [Actinidia rufa]|uniref:Hydroxyproline-rich glycoprotein family protein n=1 Tax=Actinidia rufa TaxID=165716 RepID=A0A7J0ER98_9ERIC|nr:hydroxyproline-rich glycoprotein family protein [Actinidia rufa]
MQDMKDCYDSLLSAAAATANSAYGKVLLMLGKVQFELQKLVDNYRSHIFQTITSPSESLLNEFRIVEMFSAPIQIVGDDMWPGAPPSWLKRLKVIEPPLQVPGPDLVHCIIGPVEVVNAASLSSTSQGGAVLEKGDLGNLPNPLALASKQHSSFGTNQGCLGPAPSLGYHWRRQICLGKGSACRVRPATKWRCGRGCLGYTLDGDPLGMKKQCDEKRSLFEYMITRRREKGRLKSSKGESFSSQQLQDARNEYEEEATLFVFRLKSLKQGQSRSLLTQAARHHSAQLCFFRKALKSLETIEPHVKLVTEKQHIDYQFSGIEDDDGDNDDSYDDDSDDDEGSYSELSFDYGQNDQVKNVVSTPRGSMELDRVDVTFTQVATVDAAKGNLERNQGGDYFAIGRELKTTSQSAPLSAEKKFDPAERFRQMRQLSTRKSNSYVLPTPVEPKSPIAVTDPVVSGTRQTSLSGTAFNYRHSSPLEQKRYEKILQNEKLSEPIIPSQPSVRRESNSNTTSTYLLPPLIEDLSSQQHDRRTTSDSKKIKRLAFSGPLTSKVWSNKPGLSASSPIVSTVQPKLFSGPLLRTPMPPPSSAPKLSPSASPTYVSSPKISELHELPRPPAIIASKFVGRPSNQIGYSGPLLSKGQKMIPAANKLAADVASPLPKPHLTISRSFSIPSMGKKGTLSPVLMPLGPPQTSKITEDISSPPLTPIHSSTSNLHPLLLRN